MKKLFLIFPTVLAVLTAAAAEPGAMFDSETDGVETAEFVRAIPKEIRTVAVISPASRPDKALISKAIGKMRAGGLKVKEGKWIYDLDTTKKRAQGASLERRLEDFNAAWNDPEVDLIMCTRGGSGATALIKALNWEEMKKHPKRLIGFSNITMITSAMLTKQAGHPYAGPTLGRLAHGTPESLVSFKLAMTDQPQKPFRLKALRSGDCEGGIYAGHLVMLATVEKMPDFRFDPADRIVFIECVHRTPEQLEEAWNILLDGGFFKDVKGVVFGHFTQIKPQSSVMPLLVKFASALTCPVYYGYRYGHQPDILTLDLQAHAKITDGVLTICPKGPEK